MTHDVEDLHLLPWQEVTGTCIEITIAEIGTVIVLQTDKKKYRLFLPHIIYKQLQWQLIAVLKTESPEKPFLIRKFDSPTKSSPAHNACSDREKNQ